MGSMKLPTDFKNAGREDGKANIFGGPMKGKQMKEQEGHSDEPENHENRCSGVERWGMLQEVERDVPVKS